MSPNVVLVLGFSNIFADALSMGVGEFLSSKANNEWILSERARENWEMENYPEGGYEMIHVAGEISSAGVVAISGIELSRPWLVLTCI